MSRPVKVGNVVNIKISGMFNEGDSHYGGLITKINGDTAQYLTENGEKEYKKLSSMTVFSKYDPIYRNKEAEIKPSVNSLTKNTLRYKYGLIPQTSLGSFTKGVATAFGVRTNANRDARNAQAKATLLRLKTVNSILTGIPVRGGTRRNNSKKSRLTRRR